jgi:hypothetical protein
MHISLSGVDFAVRENLWWALYYLRDEETERVLWIDALCIHQENEGERNHQVQLMGQIYADAWRVVAWLGREDQEDFAKAAEFITLLYSCSIRRRPRVPSGPPIWANPTGKAKTKLSMDSVTLPGESEESSDYIRARAQSPSGPPIVANNSSKTKVSMDSVTLPDETNIHSVSLSCEKISYRTYWSRVWIVQELILASEIVLICGNVQLDWEAYQDLFIQSDRRPPSVPLEKANGEPVHPPTHSIIPYRIHQRRSGIWGGDTPTPFTTLFGYFVTYKEGKCADVRDKIFGFRGISPKCCQDSIAIDYGLSCIDLALAVIDHDEREHQRFRSGTSSWLRAKAFIEYLGCMNDAQRIISAIEAFGGPLGPPFGANEEEQELWRLHDSSIITYIQDGKLVLCFPKMVRGEEGKRIKRRDLCKYG